MVPLIGVSASFCRAQLTKSVDYKRNKVEISVLADRLSSAAILLTE